MAALDAVVRRADWRERLIAYCASKETEPFCYGTADCLTLAGGAVEAMTGVDVWSDYRCKYTNRFGMARQLLRNGHRNMLAAAEAKAGQMGWPRVDTGQDGDIAIIHGNPSMSLAIKYHDYFIVRTMTRLVLAEIPRPAIAIWSIPHA